MIQKYENLNECVDCMLGIQAQLENYAKLSIAIRVKNITLFDINKAISEKKIVRVWAQRNTLHYYCIEELPKVIAINRCINNWFNKKWCKEETYELDIEKIFHYCVNKPFVEKATLKILFGNKYIDNWDGIFIELTRRGLVFSPMWHNGKKIYVNLGYYNNVPCLNVEELFENYTLAYKSSLYKDFNHWIGKNLLKRNNGKFECNNSSSLIMLPKFDDLLLAYNDKTYLVNKQDHNKIWTEAGNVNGVIILDKELLACWKINFQKHIVYVKKQKKVNFAAKDFDFLESYFEHKIKVEYL